ncbi:hypothetical protein Hanom_Chr07g00656791 [Helianthus anomalus]
MLKRGIQIYNIKMEKSMSLNFKPWLKLQRVIQITSKVPHKKLRNLHHFSATKIVILI